MLATEAAEKAHRAEALARKVIEARQRLPEDLSSVHTFVRDADFAARQANATATEIREGVLSPLPPMGARMRDGVEAVMTGMGMGSNVELRPKAAEVVALEHFAAGARTFEFDKTQREKQLHAEAMEARRAADAARAELRR